MDNKKINMHSIRVAYENWLYPDRFSDLLTLLKKYSCNISSVALFTSAVHIPLAIEETVRRVNIIKDRMEQIRSIGLSAGINILGTIGHHEEDLDNSIPGGYTNMTGADSSVCRGCYCMNDERFLEEYIRPVYRILAESSPDFIWIDDDVRYNHWPIGCGCFCDNCIDKFNIQNGTSYTREILTEKLNSENPEIRGKWLSHNSKTIINLFRIISETVRSTDEKITLGFMTGERYYEGYDFSAFANALSDNGKYNIMWRPGGGVYTDYVFGDLMRKAEEIGRQNAYLPENVTVIQSEIENFPYQLIKKTPKSTAVEAAWFMTSGCTGAAFNILPSETNEPLYTVEKHLKAIDGLSDFYELLFEKTAGKKPVGISVAWRPDSQISVPEGKFLRWANGLISGYAGEFFDLGFPQSYNPELSCVTLLQGKNTAHWKDEEVLELLSGNVYMDAVALENLNSRGFGSLTGFGNIKEFPVDAREFYSEHKLNSDIQGGIRNCRQAFNKGDSYAFEPVYDKAETLAGLIDYHDKTLADCCLGIYENNAGGKIAVAGYYPFIWVSDYYKSIQLKKLMVYLSGGTLPSYVESYCRICNHTFVDDSGCTVALINPTNNNSEDVTVAIKTDSETMRCCRMNGERYALKSDKKENGYNFFTVREIPGYEMILITQEK